MSWLDWAQTQARRMPHDACHTTHSIYSTLHIRPGPQHVQPGACLATAPPPKAASVSHPKQVAAVSCWEQCTSLWPGARPGQRSAAGASDMVFPD